MSDHDPLLKDALFAFREANGLHHDDHAARVWTIPVDFVTLRLPNFAWRRRAILAHDVHHMLTGYPCTVWGELQIAAWEFGAGRYPHWGATAFCLPLVIAGFLWAPYDIWRAFTRGRRAKSLYAASVLDALADMRLSDARRSLGA